MQRTLILLIILLCAGDGFAAVDKSYKVGVLSIRGVEEAVNRWQSTVDYLSEKLPELSFQLVPLTLDKTENAIKDRRVDFLLINTGQYVRFDEEYQLKPLASLKNRYRQQSTDQFGAVIFTRADRDDINNLQDLKGKRFGAVKKNAFGGFQMARRTLKEHRINPFTDFKKLVFMGFPHDDIVFAVKNQLVDAGTVRTDVLEGMVDQGLIQLDDFKILNPQSPAKFPFVLSTQLYPEWPFVALSHVPDMVRNQVKTALLLMPANHAKSLAGKHAGWSDHFDYHTVDDMFLALEVDSYTETISSIRLTGLIFIGLGVFVLMLYLLVTKVMDRNIKKVIIPASLTFMLLVTGVAIEISSQLIDEHKQGLQLTARAIGKSLAYSINLEIQQKVSLTRLVAVEYKKKLLAAAANMDVELLQQVLNTSHSVLPDYVFMVLSDADGLPLISREGAKISSGCMGSLIEFTEEFYSTDILIDVHQVGNRFHFDTMVKIAGDSSPILLISYDINAIVKHLTNIEDDNVEVLIVKKDTPNEIVFSADGLKQSLIFGETLNDQLLDQALFETWIKGTNWRLEVLARPGRLQNYESRIYWISFGTVLLSILIFSAFLWRLQKEADIRYDLMDSARTDLLTGLPNRRHLEEHIERTMAQSKRDKSKMAIYYIDLDGFKAINDKVSHEAGDMVLNNIGQKFQSLVRKNEFFARLGGDEFCLVVSGYKNEQELTGTAERLIGECSNTVKIGKIEADIGLSIGIAVYPDHGQSFRELISKADAAMYQVKKRAKGTYALAE